MGWRVFPLEPRGKEPATVHGLLEATTDEAQIRAWWEAVPDRNVGVATGGGLCVLDVDDKPANAALGSDMLRDWELAHGDIAETVTAQTGSGGAHYYYRVAAPVPSSQSDTVFVDVRCEGGYVVAPPSVHPNGSRYTWDVSPDDMEPTAAGPTEEACIRWAYENSPRRVRGRQAREGARAEGRRPRGRRAQPLPVRAGLLGARQGQRRRNGRDLADRAEQGQMLPAAGRPRADEDRRLRVLEARGAVRRGQGHESRQAAQVRPRGGGEDAHRRARRVLHRRHARGARRRRVPHGLGGHRRGAGVHGARHDNVQQAGGQGAAASSRPGCASRRRPSSGS